MHDTNDTHAPPSDPDDRSRYRTVEFADGLVIYDRTATQRWIHADETLSLADMR